MLVSYPAAIAVHAANALCLCVQRLALGSLLGVALYDSLHSAVLTDQQQQQAAEAKRNRAELQKYSDAAA
jgi:hypothetical protein